MSYKFPTEEWAAALAEAINPHEVYRTHGKQWTFGAVAMMVQEDAAIGFEKSVGFLLDVHEGECRSAKMVEGMDAVADAPFVIVAPYERWKKVIEADLDPIKGMMEGKLKMVKGNLPTMLRFVQSSRALVTSATKVPSEYIA